MAMTVSHRTTLWAFAGLSLTHLACGVSTGRLAGELPEVAGDGGPADSVLVDREPDAGRSPPGDGAPGTDHDDGGSTGHTDASVADDPTPIDGDGVFVAPTGDDAAGSGRIDAPLRSIERGLAIAPTGGTVYLRGGTYEPSRRVVIDKPITLAAYPTEHVVIQGQLSASGGVPEVSGGSRFSWNGLVEIASSDVRIVGVHLLRSNGYGFAAATERLSNVVIERSSAVECRQSGMKFFHVDGLVITESEVASCNTMWRDGLHSNWSANVSVHDCTDVVIRHNTVHHNYGSGCAVDNNANFPPCHNVLIEGNRLWNNRIANIALHGSTGGVTIRSNTAWYDPDDGPNGAGVNIRMQSAEGNFVDGGDLDDVDIYNNLLIRGADAIRFAKEGDAPRYIRNVRIYHNTMVGPFSIAALTIARVGLLGGGIRIQNNLIYCGARTSCAGDHSEWSRVVADHNLWFGTRPGALASSNDVAADPQLLEPTAFPSIDPLDYQLRADSPARNAGADLGGAVPSDFFNSPRDRPDLGFYEGAD